MKKYLLILLAATTILSCSKKADTTVVDKVRSALSTSVTTYDAVTANNWVKITAAEYTNLLTVLSGAARQGASESNMTTSSTNGWSADYTVGGNDNAAKVPASSYIVAWSVRTDDAGTSTSLGSKLKVSSSQLSGYTDYGNALPDIGTIGADTRVYFVLKTPTTATPATASYTGVYNSVIHFLGTISGGPDYYKSGDVSDPATPYPSDSHSQVISTATKQW